MGYIETNLNMAQENISQLQTKIANAQAKLPEAFATYNMYKLLQDLKNGTVILVRPETMTPVKINWMNLDDTPAEQAMPERRKVYMRGNRTMNFTNPFANF